MRSEDVNDLALAVLVVVAIALVADCVILHAKCARQARELASLSERLELHINPPVPPPEPSLADKAKQTYDKVKAAAAAGYRAAKEELGKESE